MEESVALKIAQVIDDTLDSTDGVQQVVVATGKWLTAQGHDVHYIASETSRTDIPHIHSMARNIRLKFNGNRLGMSLPADRRAIAELLRREDFDVVHIQVPYSPFLSGRLIEALPDQTALIGTYTILPLSRVARFGGEVLGRVQRGTIARFDEFLGASEPAAAYSESVLGRYTIPVGNPVDGAVFNAARDAALARPHKGGPVHVLFLGRLVERKGAGALLEAAARARSFTAQAFQVEIAGKGPLLEHYRRRVHDLGIADIVTFSGFISEEAKPRLLASADIIALPALGGESFGISLVEAFAAGTGAVLGGNNEGYSSVAGPLSECLIDPTNTEEFARRIVELIENPQERAQMSARQVERARNFSPDVVGQRILASYHRAIRARRG
jgi:phosphatidylinositol alpha-mannosyltransferase